MVEVTYSLHDDGGELIHHRAVLESYDDASALLDAYPWAAEERHFEVTGEGGGFHFFKGDIDGAHATCDFVPFENRQGLFTMDIVAAKGVLRLFGRRAAQLDLGLVSLAAAEARLHEFFYSNVDSLYRRHKRHKRH